MSTNISFEVGASVSIGGRSYQEDRLVCINDLNSFISGNSEGSSTGRSLFACFDGHGGSLASEFLAANAHLLLADQSTIKTQPINAIQKTWHELDSKLLSNFKNIARNDSAFPQAGSTGTMCLIVGSDIYVANCGDSSAYAVYSNGDDLGPMDLLTELHGTENPDEVNRIKLNGGELRNQHAMLPSPFPLCCVLSKQVVGKPRLYPGGLLVTRAFGDFYAKEQLLGGKPGVVICDHGKMEYINANSSKKGKLKYIIIGSDGLWDALNIDIVCNLLESSEGSTKSAGDHSNNNSSSNISLKAFLPVNQNDETAGKPIAAPPSMITHDKALNEELSRKAQYLCEAAIDAPYWEMLGASADNTSCIIIKFKHT